MLLYRAYILRLKYIIYINEHIPKNTKYCIFRISVCSFYEAVNILHATTFLKSKKS